MRGVFSGTLFLSAASLLTSPDMPNISIDISALEVLMTKQIYMQGLQILVLAFVCGLLAALLFCGVIKH